MFTWTHSLFQASTQIMQSLCPFWSYSLSISWFHLDRKVYPYKFTWNTQIISIMLFTPCVHLEHLAYPYLVFIFGYTVIYISCSPWMHRLSILGVQHWELNLFYTMCSLWTHRLFIPFIQLEHTSPVFTSNSQSTCIMCSPSVHTQLVHVRRSPLTYSPYVHLFNLYKTSLYI
jgi:hypothetical protein